MPCEGLVLLLNFFDSTVYLPFENLGWGRKNVGYLEASVAEILWVAFSWGP